MHPAHHLHISTGFLFMVALFVVALVGVILWYRISKAQLASEERRAALRDAEFQEYLRRPRSPDPSAEARCHAERNSYPRYDASPAPRGPAPSGAWGNAAPSYAAAPQPAPQAVHVAPAAPVYVNTSNPTGDMLMGMAIGSMMSHHDTVVHETIVHDAPAYDSGPSWDSGVSYDSGSSFDSGSCDSGGLDVSW